MTKELAAIFSDVHFGIEGNSRQRLDDAYAAIKWMCAKAKEAGATTCIFAGDWFHHRDEIDVMTASVARKAMELIFGSFRDFYLIAGNHDFYFNNSSSISSVSLFSSLGNMTVVASSPLSIKLNGRDVVLAPWFSDLGRIERHDAMIGHFEFVGGRMAGGYSKSGCSPSQMTAVAPLVFTGHYHLTNETASEGGRIVTIGSLYQQDWGDSGDDKRFLLFDGTEFRSVVNDVSPRFVKVPYSKLASVPDDVVKKVFASPAFKDATVKIVVDAGEADHDRMNALVEMASSSQMVRSASSSGESGSSLVESVEDGMQELASKDVRSYVIDFVDHAVRSMPEYASVDVEAAKTEISSYFARMESASKEEA